MALFRRTLASLGLVALLSVSGTALADDEATELTTPEESVVAVENTDVNTSENVSDADSVADEGASSEGSANQIDPEADVRVCNEWVSAGNGWETMSVSIDGKELLSVDIHDVSLGPWNEPLPDFVEAGTIPVWKFEKLFVGTKVPDFSNYQGKHKVLVVIEGTTGGAYCADKGKKMAKSAAWRTPYEFTVDFSERQPECVATHTTEELSKVKIGDTYLEVQGYLDLYGEKAQGNTRHYVLDRAQKSGSMSLADFEKVLKDFNKDIDLSAFEGKQNVEFVYHYGSTCRFVDPEYGEGLGDNWVRGYSFTVDFPVKYVPAPQPPADQGQQTQQSSRTTERPQVQPAVSSVSLDADNVDNNAGEEAEAPKLPITGTVKKAKDSKSDSAGSLTTEGVEASSSYAALFALAACLGFGVVAAVSFIAIRRVKKA